MIIINKNIKYIFILILIFFPIKSFSKVPGQPPNSYVSGSNWYCKKGYQKTGNQCVSIFADMGGQPPNSYVSGSNWYCKKGYQKTGNQCVSIFNSINNTGNNSKINTPSVNDLPNSFEVVETY